MEDRLLRLWVRAAAAFHREEGATAVEYALMVALIALVIVAAVTLLGQGTNSAYEEPQLQNALGS